MLTNEVGGKSINPAGSAENSGAGLRITVVIRMNLVLESKEQVTRDKMRHRLKGHPFRRDNSLGALIIAQCSFLGLS
jgi:hypothetical protein